MKRVRKDQLSPSEKVGVACPPGEDRARQEWKAESETSTILARFGAGQAFPAKPVQSGEVDFDLDLLGAYQVRDEAQAAFRRLPEDLQRKYQTWQRLIAAAEAGELSPPRKASEAAAAGAAGSGASASDSAPGAKPEA